MPLTAVQARTLLARAFVDDPLMWRWPAPEAPSPPETLPTTSGPMTALMGPHAYLHLLAVDTGFQRRGLGGRVLAPGLAAAGDAGLAACLETMNPADVPFYERHGFVVRHQVQLGAGGPTVWEMTTAV